LNVTISRELTSLIDTSGILTDPPPEHARNYYHSV